MPETVKLNFDDGWRSIQLGDDPERVIRINPTDTSFIKRFAELGGKAEELSSKYGDIDLDCISELANADLSAPDSGKLGKAAENLAKLEAALREMIDAAFGQQISGIVFGETWCISPVHGEPLYKHFLEVIGEYIADEIEKQNKQSAAKLIKYKAAAKSAPKRKKR